MIDTDFEVDMAVMAQQKEFSADFKNRLDRLMKKIGEGCDREAFNYDGE